MFIKKSLLEKLIEIDWGVIHIFWKIYLVKKYSPATRGIKGKIWTIEFVRKEVNTNEEINNQCVSSINVSWFEWV